MKVTLVCPCGSTFATNASEGRKYCSPDCVMHPRGQIAKSKMVSIICQTCGNPFTVYRCRMETAKYCDHDCASKGQYKNRTPWAKGKSRETDPRLARISECVKETYRRDPTRQSGEKHPFYGKRHTEATRQRLREAHVGRVATDGMKEGLKYGWVYFKGKTAATDPEVAARAKKSGDARRGMRNPKHSEWAKRYYAEHPEKHPNHICAQKGHETGLERTMREALVAAGLLFERQHPIGRYWVDFALPERRLAIEVDGAWWHDAAKDARRDAEITAMGWTVVRFSEKEVTSHTAECVATVLRFLSTSRL